MTQNCIPTFSPTGALTFVANQVRQVLADDPARCEELRGTWLDGNQYESGDIVCVPVVVFENWRNMLEASIAGCESLREQNASLAAQVARSEADNADLRGMARELVGSL